MAAADLSMNAQRQMERAGRLLDFQPHRKATPVHKSLEQHYSETRGQASGGAAVGANYLQGLAPSAGGGLGGPAIGGLGGRSGGFGPGGLGPGGFGPGGSGLGGPVGVLHARLLQGPKMSRLDRDVECFALGPSAAAATAATAPALAAGVAGTAGLAGHAGAGLLPCAAAFPLPLSHRVDEGDKDLGVEEFFGRRHERVLLSAMEEAQRDCMRSFERHSFDRIQADWDEAKAQILSTISPGRFGPVGSSTTASSTTRGLTWGSGSDASHTMVAAPPQDAVIIDAIMREPVSQALTQRIGMLSSDSCLPFRAELQECWAIVAASLRPTPRAITCGALHYLQRRYADGLKEMVFGLPSANLGGIPDAWALVRCLGRARFGAPGFPDDPSHVWYAAYVAARAGFVELLSELPTKAAPASERCPTLRSICAQIAKRLQATACPEELVQFTGGAGADVADSSDLTWSDLAEERNPFHDVLVCLLQTKNFQMGALPEGTVEDWAWFRLHALNLASQDSDEQPEFSRHLQVMQQEVLQLPAAHFDPPVASFAQLGPASVGGRYRDPLMVMGAQASSEGAVAAQTLNLVKVLLLTAQFDTAIQQLWARDKSLRAPALHMAVTLQRAGTLKAMTPKSQEAPSVAGFVCDYASHFTCGDQLQYFRALDLKDRVQALQRMLLRGDVGTNDELLGYIDNNGAHRPGLLERTLHEDGLGDRAEFAELCATSGHAAAEHGQYREAIRLLHLGECYLDVLQVLCRCLRLPIWREPAAAASEEAARLGQDLQRFFAIYERRLDAYGIPLQDWAVARKLYAARLFHGLCESGQPEAAVDLFDREQLLPLYAECPMKAHDISPEALAEYPRIIGDYVRILSHSASQGVLVVTGLRERLQKLQSFLALHSHHLALDQGTVAILAGLTLS